MKLRILFWRLWQILFTLKYTCWTIHANNTFVHVIPKGDRFQRKEWNGLDQISYFASHLKYEHLRHYAFKLLIASVVGLLLFNLERKILEYCNLCLLQLKYRVLEIVSLSLLTCNITGSLDNFGLMFSFTKEKSIYFIYIYYIFNKNEYRKLNIRTSIHWTFL